MEMVIKFIFWILIIYGTVQIIVDSTLFNTIRNVFITLPILKIVSHLMSCFMCTAVWVSFAASYWVWSPTELVFDTSYSTFLDGMLASSILWFLRIIDTKLILSDASNI